LENRPGPDKIKQGIGSTSPLDTTGIICRHRFSLLPAVASNTEIKKEYPMRLQEWEATIQQIVDECNHDEKGLDGVFVAWRAKLEKEPTSLRPFQIDEIVREARQRISNVSL
jgi:hypothetical protein